MKFKIPGFSYPGGKVRLRKWLVSMMPKTGGTYVEPFAGRGNVFWYAACALKFDSWWLNDPIMLPFFNAIKDIDLAEIPIALTPNEANRMALESRSNNPSNLSLVMSPRIMFSGGCRSGNRTVIRTSKTSIHKFRSRLYKNTLQMAKRILRWVNPSITEILWDQLCIDDLSKDDFCYLDPPYYQNNAGYELDTIDHPSFLKRVKQLSCRWLLSGYDSTLYRDQLGTPLRTREVSLFQSRLYGKATRTTRIECVWRNY